mmetsp:Transcript_1187/g.2838  ORF Transcript_1187/g.2838 Transcript_1187/m.2838 type:complete len:222 (+) Transcript_1187:112-777(+)
MERAGPGRVPEADPTHRQRPPCRNPGHVRLRGARSGLGPKVRGVRPGLRLPLGHQRGGRARAVGHQRHGDVADRRQVAAGEPAGAGHRRQHDHLSHGRHPGVHRHVQHLRPPDVCGARAQPRRDLQGPRAPWHPHRELSSWHLPSPAAVAGTGRAAGAHSPRKCVGALDLHGPGGRVVRGLSRVVLLLLDECVSTWHVGLVVHHDPMANVPGPRSVRRVPR